MANMNFSTANQTFSNLLGNGLVYRVPRFQRDYSWTQEEWEDLWQDMLGLFGEDAEPAHYMGYLVLQSEDSRQFDVIDGQQRITTLSVLVLAALANLKDIAEAGGSAENNYKRSEQLRGSYIGYLDPVTLIARSKLELNRNNNDFYQNYLVPLEHIPQRGLKSSEHLLRKAFQYFKDKLGAYLSEREDPGKEVAEFVQGVAGSLVFTVITVTDELNAFKVFETLNARGVRLSSTDLLKNYLFSVVDSEGYHEEEMKHLETRWEKIVDNLGGAKLPDFLRVYWNSKNKIVRKADLFKAIRRVICTKRQVFELLRDLEANANVFAALRNQNDELWTDRRIRSHIKELSLFGVKQPLSLLLSAYRAFPASDDGRETFRKVLGAITVASFRYNVICGLHTNEQERRYSEIAVDIDSGKLTNISGIREKLMTIYPDDQKFQRTFGEKSFSTTSGRNKRLVLYILSRLEAEASGKEIDPESSQQTLEHVLPENPGEGWGAFDDAQFERYIFALGNFALLESNINREIGNGAYESKCKAYARSVYETTRRLPDDYPAWNPQAVEQRQAQMAEIATRLWRFSD